MQISKKKIIFYKKSTICGKITLASI